MSTKLVWIVALCVLLGSPPVGHADEKAVAHLEAGRVRLMVVGDAEMVCDQLGPKFWLSRMNGLTGFHFVGRAVGWLGLPDELRAVDGRKPLVPEKESGGAYTLEPTSRNILKSLEDPALVRVFWHNLPDKLDAVRPHVAALLQAMTEVAGHRVDVEWVDMKTKRGRALAGDLGVRELDFRAVHGDELQETKGYQGLSIEVGDQRPFVLNPLSAYEEELEYLIVSQVHVLTRVRVPVTGLVTPGSPDDSQEDASRRLAFSELTGLLQEMLGDALRPDLGLDTPVPEDVVRLVVVAPRGLGAKQAYHLEQFLLRGGRGLLLLDPVDMFTVLGTAPKPPQSSGLEAWLTHVGVRVGTEVVGDFDPEAGGFYPERRRIQKIGRYAYWPRVLPPQFDAGHAVMRGLEALPLYWPVAVDVDAKVMKAAGRSATVLATTTGKGYRRPDLAGVERSAEKPKDATFEKIPLIVWVDGPLKSLWQGKPPR